MHLTFTSLRLQRLAESPGALQAALGPEGAEDAKAVLNDLRSVPTLEDMRALPGNCRQAGDRFAVSLPDGGGIVFEPVWGRPRASTRQIVSWARIQTVEICAITADLLGFDNAFRVRIRRGISS